MVKSDEYKAYRDRNKEFLDCINNLMELTEYELHIFEEKRGRPLSFDKPVIKNNKKSKKILDKLVRTRKDYERALDKAIEQLEEHYKQDA
tara:strand:+ start:230 stop:499 length:270 start_codon:yes stop_codon:yes gene_type:complete